MIKNINIKKSGFFGKLKEFKRRLRYPTVDFDVERHVYWLGLINEYSIKQNLESISDSRLKAISYELINQARSGADINSLLVKAYALVREASWRVLKMRPFDVQVIAAISMHNGDIVEMQTGEGKTLAAVMTVYLNAISGKGVHVLTFNDYLAQRDAEWMGPLYNYLGLTVGYIKENMTINERRNAYDKDITYLTAKEAGFDYLKGFLLIDKSNITQRPFNFALIDEADSILIDEARIPMVIAGQVQGLPGNEMPMMEIVKNLKKDEDYELDEYERNVSLTDKGLIRVENILGCDNLYDVKNLDKIVAINNALHAEALLKRDIDYIVRNNKIELVDEFTGRIADKRHWPYGLQEAIEAKEGITSEKKGKILASINLQNFIHLYPKVCGMTGTALNAANEFDEFYGLKVAIIPTNKPCIREDYILS